MTILADYKECCKVRKKCKDSDENTIDMEAIRFISPIHNILLTQLIIEYGEKDNIILPSNPDAKSYFVEMIKQSGMGINGKQHMPYKVLPQDYESMTPVQDHLIKLLKGGQHIGGQLTAEYMLNELICNVYEHSCFDHACAAAQSYKKYSMFAIFDNGITIPGSMASHGVDFTVDYEAIHMAINGISTKPEQMRGYGLSTCDSLSSKLKMELLIISRDGALFKDKKDKYSYYKLTDNFKIQGTLISIRSHKNTQLSNEEFYSIVG